MTVTISGGVIAWYGAIVATASFLISGYIAGRDRARLRVEVDIDMRLSGHPAYSNQEPVTIITVYNVGRRTVYLEEWPCFQEKGEKIKGYMIKGPWEPSDALQEGQSAKMLCRQDSMDIDIAEFQRVVVRDKAGRAWKARIPRKKTS